MSEPLPSEVLYLVHHYLPTMEHVELLLMLARDDTRRWTPAEAAAEAKSTVAGTHTRLRDLERAGLAVADPADEAYRYSPATATFRNATEELRRIYNTRPVSLVRAVYERPPSALRSFADAFRLRREDD